MNKIERVRATLAGRPVDRAPFTVWYHFGGNVDQGANSAAHKNDP